MNFRKLAMGLLLTAVMAATGCWHTDKCQPEPTCCPPPGRVVTPLPGAPVAAPPAYYYAPAPYPR